MGTTKGDAIRPFRSCHVEPKAEMSLANGGEPLNSSAPISGVVELRVSPSTSKLSPTDVPPDSRRVCVPLVIWRSVLDTNGGGE